MFFFVLFGLCLIVFFFKQKTAYEMRISDWSSDVCSSDLVGAGDEDPVPAVVAAAGPDLGAVDHVGVAVANGSGAQRGQVGAGVEIGRASGGERVCQYV